mmetsp:Transcript_109455/g.223710  ORF Transcript_109455/g.223710 Transcript_109455/m.223710 type:complete len:302 (-) Transcript_109455:67-972(-)
MAHVSEESPLPHLSFQFDVIEEEIDEVDVRVFHEPRKVLQLCVQSPWRRRVSSSVVIVVVVVVDFSVSALVIPQGLDVLVPVVQELQYLGQGRDLEEPVKGRRSIVVFVVEAAAEALLQPQRLELLDGKVVDPIAVALGLGVVTDTITARCFLFQLVFRQCLVAGRSKDLLDVRRDCQVQRVHRHQRPVAGGHQVRFDVIGTELQGQPVSGKRVFREVGGGPPVGDHDLRRGVYRRRDGRRDRHLGLFAPGQVVVVARSRSGPFRPTIPESSHRPGSTGTTNTVIGNHGFVFFFLLAPWNS